MKLLHLADLHLDSPFSGIGQQSSQLQKRLIQSPYKALEKGVDAAIDRCVDAVVIAGDIYDANRQTVYAQHFFINQLKRLEVADIPVVLIHGNHDFIHPGQLTPNYPSNVYSLDDEAVTFVDLDLKSGESVRFYGFSYHHRWIQTNKVEEFPVNPKETDYVVGLYHGAPEGENYAPFKVQDMVNKNYDYWALGHIHQPWILHKSPLIQYAGTPQGRHRNEVEDMGAAVVTLTKGQPTQSEFISLAEITWHHQRVVCNESWTGQELLQALEEMVYNYLQSAQATGQSQLLSVVLERAQLLETSVIDEVRNGEILEVLHNSSPSAELFVQIVDLKLSFDYEDELFEYDPSLNASYQQALEHLYEGDEYEKTMKDFFNHAIVRTWLQDLSQNKDLKEAIVQGAHDLMVQKIGFEDEEGDYEN